jgi:trimeric autotransporter adhesin
VEFPYGVPSTMKAPFYLTYFGYIGAYGGTGVGQGAHPWHYVADSTAPNVTLCPDPDFPGAGASHFLAPASQQSTENSGTMVMLDYGKGAFRAGTVTGAEWQNVNRGTYSVAFGYNNVASGDYSAVAGGQGNSATEAHGFVGGGEDNHILDGGTNGSLAAAICGGSGNVIGDTQQSDYSFIGGGFGCSINGLYSVIAGGGDNTVDGNYGTISGGNQNFAESGCTVSGGTGNQATGTFTVVPGGQDNSASGSHSFAGGNNAHATNANSFVWGDGEGGVNGRVSTADRQFLVGCDGGAIFYSSPDTSTGVSLAPGSSAWAAVSDRNAKENLVKLDGKAVLAKIDRLPIYEYNYKRQDAGQVYRGPVAQEWHALFPSGKDPLRIDTLDLDGISLAAIKGLSALAKEQADTIRVLSARVNFLEKRVAGCPAKKTR